MHSYPHGPSESKIERAKQKQKHLVHFAPASRSGKHSCRYRPIIWRPFFPSPVFDQHGITWQQYNVLRHPARAQALGGLSDTGHRREDDRNRHRVINPAWLDRLEGKEVSCARERPSDNRRQVSLLHHPSFGLDLLRELDSPPLGKQDNQVFASTE